jgi:simple sugar transport system permease protein
MRIELLRRPQHSQLMALTAPIIAVALTVITGFVVFWSTGIPPVRGLYVFFVEPLTAWWSIEELITKSTPLILIGVGLTLCYRANAWNIGAEGQLIAGAIAGSILPVLMPAWNGPLILPAMLLMGILGGMIYAAIPALLKIRFNTSEILTSLMLVYVAQLLVDYLARGPWRNPAGRNFPDSRRFEDGQVIPALFGNVRLSVVFVVIAVALAWWVLRKTMTGYQISVLGQSPRAGAFAGFSQKRMVLLVMLVSGGLAGLAGICEVAGPIGQLRVSVSPGYGFTAIIVAFLGRLHPAGAVLAGLVLGLTYLGGEGAQIALRVPEQMTRVFQGMLLFFVLACDTLIYYRLRLVTHHAVKAEAVRGN